VSAELVLVRRGGALWGIRTEEVAAVEGRGGRVSLRLAAGGELPADGVVALAHGVAVHAQPESVRRRLPSGVAGLALWHAEPVAVLGAGRGGRA
jgi:hypothetical protein